MAFSVITPLVAYSDLEKRPESFGTPTAVRSSPRKVLASLFVYILVLSSLTAVIYNQLLKPGRGQFTAITIALKQFEIKPSSIRVESLEKVVGEDYSIRWQRSVYHFQPDKNFISDPNGPLYHMGWYHLFYQYNPHSAIWGNITWGHAASKDLINWFHLPLAMVPDQWYDLKGVMTGSATVLPDGRIMMYYTGNAHDLSQLQCMAYPANSSDPLLVNWVKYEGNPILAPPPGVGLKDFRDPSTLWIGPDGRYRMVMGSKHNNTIGCALIYHTTNFTHFELLDEVLHSVPGTGMWECVDLYPISMKDTYGLDMSSYELSDAKYVLKQSGDEDRHDWYAIGSYDPVKDKWYPDDPEMDVGIGLRYDYGKFYASKTFYDPSKRRRVLWGYVGETDLQQNDLKKGWANMLNVPRTVVLDPKTQTNLLQWPVEETETLRSESYDEFKDVELRPGSLVPLDIGSAAELDISASFEVDEASMDAILEADLFNCTTSQGSAMRGVLGPFGVVVLADAALSEQTPVYFYIAKNIDGTSRTYFCADESRSSKLSDVGKVVYGSTVPVLHGENYNMRLLVDHSIIESFAQGGRTVITSRVYPTKAIYDAAKVFLFNNSTGITVKASLKIWKMGGAKLAHFPF